jgi:hypothetical protein
MRSHGSRALVATGLLGPLVLGAAGLWILVASSGVADAAPKTDPVNLTQFIGPDFFAALVVHPSRLAKAPMFAGMSLPDMPLAGKASPAEVALVKEFLKPEKIRRVVALVASTAEGGVGQSPVTVGVIFQFNEDVDSESFLKQNAKLSGEDLESVTVEGVTCYVSKAAAAQPNPAAKASEPPVMTFVAGPRTLVVGPEAAMKKMLAPATGPRPLLEQLKHSSLNNDVLIQIAAEPLLKSGAGAALKAMTQGQPKQPFADLIDDVQSIALALNVTQEPLLKLAVRGTKPDSPDKFFGLMQMAKMGIPAALEGAKKNLSAMLPPDIKEPLFKVADEIVKGLNVAKEGDEVALTIAQPASLPALVQKVPELAKTIIAGFGQGGPAATPPGADPFAPNAGPGTKPPAANADPFAPNAGPALRRPRVLPRRFTRTRDRLRR